MVEVRVDPPGTLASLPGLSVSIGGQQVALRRPSADSLAFDTPLAPANLTATVTVEVRAGARLGSASFTYQAIAPTLGAVSPANGPAAGGTALTISGAGFAAGTRVEVGNASATVTGVGPTSLQCQTPAGSGTVDVTVIHPEGLRVTLVGAFRYDAPPPPPPPQTKLAFVDQPSTTREGVAISPAVRVAIQDASGATVTGSTAAVTVAIGTNPGGATLSGTRTVNAVAGVATFTDLRLDRPGAGYTLDASSAPLASAASSTFTVDAAPVALAFIDQPSTTRAGVAISPAVRVAIQDARGATVTGSTAAVTVAIGTNPGGATLSGTRTVNAVAGVATFTNLRLDRAGAGYTLTAASFALSGATSSTFAVDDHGDDAGTATNLPLATSRGLAIQLAGDRDWFAVTLVAGTTYTFRTQALSAGMDSVLTLHDRDGTTLLDENDNDGLALSSRIDRTPATSGVYFLQVRHFSVSSFNVGCEVIATATPPGAPSGLAATAVSAGRVDLTWTDGSTSEDGFRVERSPQGAGTFTSIGTAAANATTFSDMTTTALTAYDYRVRAFNAGGDSANSNTAQATTPAVGSLALRANPGTVTADPGVSREGLVRHYRFEEQAGATAKDDSPTAAHGAVEGGEYWTGFGLSRVTEDQVERAPRRQVAGRFGGGLRFDGRNDRVSCGTVPSIASTDDWSWSVWVFLEQTTQSNPNGVILGNRVGAQFVKLTPNAFEYSPSGSISHALPTRVWVHVAVVKRGGALTYYRDGAVVGSLATTQALASVPLWVGGDPQASEMVRAVIDEVRLYRRALSASEVGVLVTRGDVETRTALPALEVELRDLGGALLAGATDEVTLSLAQAPSGGRVSGPLRVRAVGGVASFAGLSFDPAGTYALQVSAPGYTGATSPTFTVEAPRLEAPATPVGAQAGVPLAPAPVVRVRDGQNALLPLATARPSLDLVGGGLGGALQVEARAGVATFEHVKVPAAGGGYQLQASAPGFQAATSGAFSVAALAPAPLVSAVSPAFGSAASATFVTITGAGFDASCVASAGDVPLTGQVLVNATTITGSVPAGAAGALDVVVRGGQDGRGEARLVHAFHRGVVVAGVSPATALAGATVRLLGSGYEATASASFGGVVATTTRVDANTLSVVVPVGAGTVDVLVQDGHGSGSRTSAFTYGVAPAAPISAARLELDPLEVVADGRSAVELLVRATDGVGAAVPDGTAVVVETSAGLFGRGGAVLLRTTSGRATARLIAPGAAGTVTLTLRDGATGSALSPTGETKLEALAASAPVVDGTIPGVVVSGATTQVLVRGSGLRGDVAVRSHTSGVDVVSVRSAHGGEALAVEVRVAPAALSSPARFTVDTGAGRASFVLRVLDRSAALSIAAGERLELAGSNRVASLSIALDGELRGVGLLPLLLAVDGDAVIDGTIDVSGLSSTPTVQVEGGGVVRCGGGGDGGPGGGGGGGGGSSAGPNGTGFTTFTKGGAGGWGFTGGGGGGGSPGLAGGRGGAGAGAFGRPTRFVPGSWTIGGDGGRAPHSRGAAMGGAGGQGGGGGGTGWGGGLSGRGGNFGGPVGQGGGGGAQMSSNGTAGGGGGFGTAGTSGRVSQGASSGGGPGGQPYGSPQLYELVGGSGGGGGSSRGGFEGLGGGGGGGGGALALLARGRIDVRATAALLANGGAATHPDADGEAGCGSGGAIVLEAPEVRCATGARVEAMNPSPGSVFVASGTGRVRVDASTLSRDGTTVGTATFAGFTQPSVGFFAAAPATVSVTTPGASTGVVDVPYVVTDDGSRVWLTVEWSTGGAFSPATAAAGSEPTFGVSSTTGGGQAHLFGWDSRADLGVGSFTVTLRITVVEPRGSSSVTSGAFAVTN